MIALLPLDISKLIKAIKTMLLVVKLNFTSELMVESSHEKIIELITLIVPNDLGSILELEGLVAFDVESG